MTATDTARHPHHLVGELIRKASSHPAPTPVTRRVRYYGNLLTPGREPGHVAPSFDGPASCTCSGAGRDRRILIRSPGGSSLRVPG